MDILTHGELIQIRKGIESIASSLEKLAAPVIVEDAAHLDGWKEKGPGPLLVQNSEDAKKMLFQGLYDCIAVGHEEAAKKIIANFFEGREDTDRKLAIAYGELSELRKTRNAERVAGMRAMRDLFAVQLVQKAKVVPAEVTAAMNAAAQLLDMNMPQKDEVNFEVFNEHAATPGGL